MSSRMATALRTSASPNFRITSFGSLQQMCSSSLFKMSANKTETGTCSFSNSRSFVACSRLIASSNASKSYTMGCGNISTTKYLRRQLSGNPLLEIVSDQRKMTFVDPNPSNSMIVEKACSELTSLSCVELTMRSSINSKASRNTKFVGVRIQRQQILFVSKPFGQTPHSNM